MRRYLFIVLTIWGLQACDDVEDGAGSGEVSTDSKKEDGAREDDTSGNGEDMANQGGMCGEPSYESIGWDEVLESGTTPAELFGPFEGECSSPFSWNAAPFDMHTITPQSGETVMNVSVVLDKDSAKIGRYEYVPEGGDRDCPAFFIEATANAALETEGGVFVDSGEITIIRYPDRGLSTLSLDVPLESLKGSLNIELEKGESGALHYRFGGANDSCVGEVNLSLSMSAGDGTGVSMVGKLGSWSNTSCGLEEAEVDLEAKLPNGNTVLSKIASTWGGATYAGTWDDGGTTELKIAVEATQTVACQTRTTTLVPVSLTYGTTDGRITETTAPADIDVAYDAAGNVRTMQLWLSHDMTCASTTDVIPYTAKSCEVLEGVTVQFGISLEQDGHMSVRDEGLMVYEYHRNGDGPSGGADHVAILELGVN